MTSHRHTERINATSQPCPDRCKGAGNRALKVWFSLSGYSCVLSLTTRCMFVTNEVLAVDSPSI